MQMKLLLALLFKGEGKSRKQIKEQIVRWEKKPQTSRNASIYQSFCWPNKQSLLLQSASKGHLEDKNWHFCTAWLVALFAPNENNVAFTAGLLGPCHHLACASSQISFAALKNWQEFPGARVLLWSSQHQWAQLPPQWFQPISSPRTLCAGRLPLVR